MAEKFREIVATPEEAAKKLRQKIAEKNPVEYIRARRTAKNAANQIDENAEIKDAAAIMGLRTAKGAAWLAAGGAQFLLMLARWLTLDNAALRKMEEKFAKINVGKNNQGKPKKLSSFAKKYPNLSAHILWYFMLASLIGGGRVAVQYGPDLFQEQKEWRIDDTDDIQDINNYNVFLNKMRPITPFLIADLIAKEGVHVDKTGMHVPYRDSRGIPTIGFGSTMLKDGSRVTMKTKPITTAEAYELARWHLEEGETYFVLYCYDVATDGININTTSQALGLSSIVYNAYSKLIENPKDKNHQARFDALRTLYDKYGYAVPDSMVQQCFKQYPIVAPTSFGQALLEKADVNIIADKLGGFLAGGRGMAWRRWLEAGLLTGDITPQMLLDCPVNGMYEFFRVMGEKKSAFFTGNSENRHVNKKTYGEFKKWLQNPVNKYGKSLKNWARVKDYLPAEVLSFCQNGNCELGNIEFEQLVKNNDKLAVQTYVIGYDEEYANAVSAYKSGDFILAADRFEKMIEKYPDNALLHNDLAVTYNKLGRYSDAINHARVILHSIGDKSQYAAAQYNAGVAYEHMGDLQRALQNYKLSVANGNSRVRTDVARVQKKLKQQKITAFNKGAVGFNESENMQYLDFSDFVNKDSRIV